MYVNIESTLKINPIVKLKIFQSLRRRMRYALMTLNSPIKNGFIRKVDIIKKYYLVFKYSRSFVNFNLHFICFSCIIFMTINYFAMLFCIFL